ncbi:MAG TPA: nitronate monooxygenase [Rhodanobacteraceae bacterium]
MVENATLLHLPGVTCPIVQAPMAGVATPALAAAVSNAGGLGGLGCGSSSVDAARRMIADTRALTDKPFNVNFFCHQPARPDAAREAAWLDHLRPYFAEWGAAPPAHLAAGYGSFVENRAMLDMLLDERPAVASFIFGVPPVAWVGELKRAGIVTLGCATSLEDAARVEACGMDAIVAQGMEAGGHRGVFDPHAGDRCLGTLPLVRLLATHCRVPIIVAGGIMDGAGMAAAMRLGAVGVQLGTAFIGCPESAASQAHRAALASERSRCTRITDVISGRPARGIVNRMQVDIAGNDAPALPDYPIAYAAGKALAAAARARGSHDFDAQWAGQGAPLARAMPAAGLVATLMREWRDAEA